MSERDDGEPRVRAARGPSGVRRLARETGMSRRVMLAGVLMASTFILGIVGYHVIGGADYTWLDSVYMTANVLTTTGFREVIDVKHRPGGQIFTIILLLFGAATVVYFTSVVTAFVVEGDLTQGFRRRRMERAIRTLSNHYIVCGASQTGVAVLRELVTTGRHVCVIESSDEVLAALGTQFPDVPVVAGDFTHDDTLVAAGIGRAVGIVLCTDNDKDSLVATVMARQLNPRIRVVARATNERALSHLQHAGADAVVSPALIGGMRMASELVRPSVVGFLDQMLRDKNRNLRIEEIEIPRNSPFAEKSCAEIAVRDHGDLLLLAVKDPETAAYVYNPPATYRVSQGAQLIVMGDPQSMRSLRKRAEGDGPSGNADMGLENLKGGTETAEYRLRNTD